MLVWFCFITLTGFRFFVLRYYFADMLFRHDTDPADAIMGPARASVVVVVIRAHWLERQ
jgi:hypothetical protein